MRDLLPYYTEELAFLKASSEAFAQQFPRVASHLAGGLDVADDPHVGRLIESFALLAARVHKRLDDDFPQFTESLLEVLYPHYLRPFPSCSIARLDPGSAGGQLTKPVRLPRGMLMHSRPVRGVACRFRSAYDVDLQPVRLTEVRYESAWSAGGLRAEWPDGLSAVTSALRLGLESLSSQVPLADALTAGLRLFVNGEAARVSALRETLTRRVAGVMLQAEGQEGWSGPFLFRPRAVGFDANESLLEWDERSPPAYRLLSEFFAFPEKFNFVDVCLPFDAPPLQLARRVTVQLLIAGVSPDSDEARLLETVDASHLLMHCTPVVNLFQQPTDPVRVTHQQSAYPLVVDARRAWAYDIYAIDRVSRVRRTAQGETVDVLRPFYSLQHDDLWPEREVPSGRTPSDAGWGAATMGATLGAAQGASVRRADAEGPAHAAGGPAGRYWYARRDESVAEHSPGHEVELAIVDIDFDPVSPQTDTLSVMVTATNRDLPSQLPVGQPGGDLMLEGGGLVREITLLRKSTPALRLSRDRGVLWRLVSHLSLNHLSLCGSGLDGLKEMLRLYDLPRSAANRRIVDGLLDVSFQPATAWLPGEPFACFVRGTEVRLVVDDTTLVGCGLHLFAQVMERFFALYVHVNSFSQLTILSGPGREEVMRCPPRSGLVPLL